MTEHLIDLVTKKLMEKFGAGNHKPGSGSASAFQGMLAAQMLKTVIDLTLDPKRRHNYASHIVKLNDIKKDIETEIYPELERLFQLDSVQFDNVISLRKKRDNPENQKRYYALNLEAQDALAIATETPIKIAELCLRLGNHAEYVFLNGFAAAKGDSAVAINCAVSAIASCLSIVQLNLKTLPVASSIESLKQQASRIKVKYLVLRKLIDTSLESLENEATESRDFQRSIAQYKQGNLEDTIITNADIEKLVQNLQNTLWLQRKRIWKKNPTISPLDILQADVVLKKVMGYSYIPEKSLGRHRNGNDVFEIAGLIDKNARLVQVSTALPEEIQNFTLAHELGHALLHKQTLLHRDRPVDGHSMTARTREEMQADKFAAYFLMPKKLVEDVFFEFFGTDKFLINEASTFAMGERDVEAFKQRCGSKRGLALKLASTELYGGKSFKTIAKIFKVSEAAMAIRLEELELLEF